MEDTITREQVLRWPKLPPGLVDLAWHAGTEKLTIDDVLATRDGPLVSLSDADRCLVFAYWSKQKDDALYREWVARLMARRGHEVYARVLRDPRSTPLEIKDNYFKTLQKDMQRARELALAKGLEGALEWAERYQREQGSLDLADAVDALKQYRGARA